MDIEYWIQIENHAWDVSPNNIDRMTGQLVETTPGGVTKTLISPVTMIVRNRTMYRPLDEEALILRRYTANWAAPDDRKVNPWDINEPDPTDNGTMGTIPGPVLECSVGDRVIVHFRNMDMRSGKDLKTRTHSLHPHGFVFSNRYDGAYPLSPPDPTQPVAGEAALWSALGVTGSKKGDRVPPGATFTYIWNTFGWPTTAGVWLYHDHAICDMENVQLGALGIIVIHNPADPDDVITPDLPNGLPNGSPIRLRCFPFPNSLPTLPHDLNPLGLDVPGVHSTIGSSHGSEPKPHSMAGMTLHEGEEHDGPGHTEKQCEHCEQCERCEECQHCDHDEDAPRIARAIKRGNITLELDEGLAQILRICLPVYRTPPTRAQYLQLYHNLGDQAMCINGRKYLGNTPTLIAGLQTKMRFGLVGMGNVDGFHTFHLHGHRWTIPGPDGNNPGAIQNSPQITAVSQFEDTRTFGPANSFSFTVNQGSFMGSVFTPNPQQAGGLGEWHMHCHVLNHMMDGMMGSLLVIQGGELALGLPSGEPCPPDTGGGCEPGAAVVNILGGSFDPPNVMISAGQKVCWTNAFSIPHTVTSNPGTLACAPISTEAFASPVLNSAGETFTHLFNTPGTYAYHCEVHGCTMAGTVTVL